MIITVRTYMVRTYTLYTITMSKINKTIALNDADESFQVWKELFEREEQNFSEWIRLKLLEEKEKRMDKSYIHKQIADAESKVEFWKKQLTKSEQETIAKQQKINETNGESYSRQLDGTIWKMKMYRDECDEALLPLAEKYLDIPEDKRPSVKEFLMVLEATH